MCMVSLITYVRQSRSHKATVTNGGLLVLYVRVVESLVVLGTKHMLKRCKFLLYLYTLQCNKLK